MPRAKDRDDRVRFIFAGGRSFAAKSCFADAVQSTRDISRDTSERWMVRLENGKTMSALDVQWEFHHLAQKHLDIAARN